MKDSNHQSIIADFFLADRPKLAAVATSFALAFSALLASAFFLFKKTAFFDDSFIYLHMAANIVDAGTARYFPIAESKMLLASSPLRLLTLVPAFLILHLFDLPLRTIESARFALLARASLHFSSSCLFGQTGSKLTLYWALRSFY